MWEKAALHDEIQPASVHVNNRSIPINFKSSFKPIHCVKSVQIGTFFWSVFSRNRTEYGEILRKNTLKVIKKAKNVIKV